MVSLLLIVLFGVAAIALLLAPRPTRRLVPVARMQTRNFASTPTRDRSATMPVGHKVSRIG
ncbi:hypothetical protein ACFP9V_08330 [Deinococcus radiopugnans]|uniref:Uncharacterized protein n=1 Tax=Deinococcus radiopugnans ATCC 19172 TaxID=585398 RepID=A0A5C4Y6Z5_9DEIO|nr:hypothetical protein [Deinococcus radiopugnans]MBB6016313.1 hypothetical protein [Deinococcus radiopugnans ATCC 19172]QLG12229.1 hypothetical protein HLB42_16615 [Deinococcus sp. D7000]TNM71282.1 hypothetical protein FHR04_08865 [Deinococcus radiopugnans ATCC 19172]